MRRRLLSALLLGASALGGAESRFSFVAIGCMPYERQEQAYERLLAEINRHSPAFAVHLGDTQPGSAKPTEERMNQVKTWFNSLECPLIYTPGDNEWTDVHRSGEDPLAWLARIRATFFAKEESLGRRPLPLITQRRDWEHEKFVENARWTMGGVVFATVHIVGSNNNLDPKRPEAVQEFRARDEANRAWAKAAFAEARAQQAPGVVLFFQAQPFGAAVNPKTGVQSGFVEFLDTVEREAKAFGKPVLLVHADEHRYRNESGLRFRAGDDPLPNVTRLETFGDKNIHGVLVVVDPASPQLFLSGPLWVPGNPLPSLPAPKK